MKKISLGFTLIELVTVMILVGIISVVLMTRMGSTNTAAIQSGRDDLIAALFFAQQQAMMRSEITLKLTANSVSVNENDNPIQVSSDFYPLAMPAGVSLPTLTLSYDKLGRLTTAPQQIVLTGSGNSSGVTAIIQVDASGYAYAQ